MTDMELVVIDEHHALAERVFEVLVNLYGLASEKVSEYLSADDIVVAGLAHTTAGNLEAFVVFESLKRRFADSSYSSMYRQLVRLLPAENLKAHYSQIMWWSPQQTIDICGEVIDRFHAQLAPQAAKIVLLVGAVVDEKWDQLNGMLTSRGFKKGQDQFLKLAWELPTRELTVNRASQNRELRVGDIVYRIFADVNVDLSAMTRCYNAAVFDGEESASTDDMRTIVEGAHFDAQLSVAIFSESCDCRELIAFAHVLRREPSTAEIEMLAVNPKYRGRNVSMNGAPLFFAACEREKIETVLFTINPVNAPIRAIIDKHTNAREIEHRITLFRVTEGQAR